MESIIGAMIPIFGIGVFGVMIVGPIWIISYFKNRERQRLHDTLRLMVEKGQPVSGELLETLKSSRPRVPPNDMRRGVILLSVALGLAGLGIVLGLTGDGDAVGFFCGVAAIPAFIGIGFIALALINRDKPKA